MDNKRIESLLKSVSDENVEVHLLGAIALALNEIAENTTEQTISMDGYREDEYLRNRGDL